VTYENYVKSKLVDLVIVDAYHQGGVEPMLAVAQVIANRVNAGWQGGDWLKVIQAAPESRGTTWTGDVQPEPRDISFRELLRRIDDVYHGTADDSAVNNEQDQKSLYYAELHNITRRWFRETILAFPEDHPRIAKVGQMDFFA
jgi:hypothetical protein